MKHLRTTEAQALQKAVLKARQALDDAHEKYHALAVRLNVRDASEEEIRAIRREGRAYAHALTQYSNATMAWLTYVDTHLRPEKTSGPEQTH